MDSTLLRKCLIDEITKHKLMSDEKGRMYADELDLILKKSAAKGIQTVEIPNAIPVEHVRRYVEKHKDFMTLRLTGNQHDGETWVIYLML